MKIKLCAFLLVLVVLSLTFTGCDGLFGSDSDTTKYNDSMESSTGKWSLLGDTDTYFVFDGSNGVMTFSYFEDGAEKYGGKFRALYRSHNVGFITKDSKFSTFVDSLFNFGRQRHIFNK